MLARLRNIKEIAGATNEKIKYKPKTANFKRMSIQYIVFSW
jgi:hypothetical protein